jgi:hypothetical protein
MNGLRTSMPMSRAMAGLSHLNSPMILGCFRNLHLLDTQESRGIRLSSLRDRPSFEDHSRFRCVSPAGYGTKERRRDVSALVERDRRNVPIWVAVLAVREPR